MAMTNYTLSEMAALSMEEVSQRWRDLGPMENILPQFIEDVRHNTYLTKEDIAIIGAVTLAYTLHRFIITMLILKPITRFIQFSSKDELRFCESCCKLFYYLCFVIWEYYLVNILYPDLRTSQAAHWKGWHPNMEIPELIKYLYYFEAGFYFHSIFATIFMDVWKKDSIAMIIHHILANTLILFSMTSRYHCIGLIVMYLHDVADIFLESSKIVLSFKNKSPSMFLEVLGGIGFVCFSGAWLYLRLLVFPSLVLFSSSYVAFHGNDRKFYFPFNIMLFMLFSLNIYWFHFIVALIVRVATGTNKTLDDNREYEEDEEENKKQQ